MSRFDSALADETVRLDGRWTADLPFLGQGQAGAEDSRNPQPQHPGYQKNNARVSNCPQRVPYVASAHRSHAASLHTEWRDVNEPTASRDDFQALRSRGRLLRMSSSSERRAHNISHSVVKSEPPRDRRPIRNSPVATMMANRLFWVATNSMALEPRNPTSATTDSTTPMCRTCERCATMDTCRSTLMARGVPAVS